MSQTDVLIIGGGLAGLCCARRLHEARVSFQVLEASDCVGGRVRTDTVEDFRLDRGFQTLLTSYPEAQAQLNFAALELCPFGTGALVRRDHEFFRVSDPWREPSRALATFASPIGTVRDKVRMAALRRDVLEHSPQDLFARPETTTREALHRRRFSHAIIQSFFQPLFAGILLDSTLGVSSRMFEFTFRMLAQGRAALPARGMQTIPDHLASNLPEGSVRCLSRVHSIAGNKVTLESGESMTAEAVVVATDGPQAARWCKEFATDASRSVSCLYFAAPEPPIDAPLLVLNAEGRGLINNLSVPSVIAPSYAPRNRTLVAVSVLNDAGRSQEVLIRDVQAELQTWFGAHAGYWRPLAVYRIRHALPALRSVQWVNPANRARPGLYVCGDHRGTPSIQGAMLSGRLTAEAVLADQVAGSAAARQQSGGA
jgi:phytoene dehydrogenase-like protein